MQASWFRIGMDSTFNYTWCLHLFLTSSAELSPFDPQFFILNPSVVHGFMKNYTHSPKTEDIDAKEHTNNNN